MERPDFFRFHNGNKSQLPFQEEEYNARQLILRQTMIANGIDAVLFTSMHNIAYFSGFLYCSFGRPYGLVITGDCCISISANIDAGQPWRRSVDDNITYTDWGRDNFWRAINHVIGVNKVIGIEKDNLTLSMHEKMKSFLKYKKTEDISHSTMIQRMKKTAAEIFLIKEGARIADIGGQAIRNVIREGITEIDVAMAGRDAMESAIKTSFPDAEYRDTWVWFQSGINTDGAHNPVTNRILKRGDILSLNAFPMIQGYYTALERTLWLGEPDVASLKIWKTNVAAHELGLGLLEPGRSCSEICQGLNEFFSEYKMLKYRSFGYGHSFGILSHYYGRESGLELREDIDTILEEGMVISMEPMLTIPQGQPGEGGYREHDIVVLEKTGPVNITKFPYGPEHNIISC